MVSASQEQALSCRGARVYTAHRGWLGVVMGIIASSTGGVLVSMNFTVSSNRRQTWWGMVFICKANIVHISDHSGDMSVCFSPK